MEPIFIEYQELEQITDGFSEKRKLGEGGYGKVYWVRLQTCYLLYAVYCTHVTSTHYETPNNTSATKGLPITMR